MTLATTPAIATTTTTTTDFRDSTAVQQVVTDSEINPPPVNDDYDEPPLTAVRSDDVTGLPDNDQRISGLPYTHEQLYGKEGIPVHARSDVVVVVDVDRGTVVEERPQSPATPGIVTPTSLNDTDVLNLDFEEHHTTSDTVQYCPLPCANGNCSRSHITGQYYCDCAYPYRGRLCEYFVYGFYDSRTYL